jgi:hypothetical protein
MGHLAIRHHLEVMDNTASYGQNGVRRGLPVSRIETTPA